jgi:hypothetical protein
VGLKIGLIAGIVGLPGAQPCVDVQAVGCAA